LPACPRNLLSGALECLPASGINSGRPWFGILNFALSFCFLHFVVSLPNHLIFDLLPYPLPAIRYPLYTLRTPRDKSFKRAGR
jgi:hypothetical protein